MKISKFLSVKALILLTINKIASSKGFSPLYTSFPLYRSPLNTSFTALSKRKITSKYPTSFFRTFAIRCAVETSLFYSHYFESSRAETWMEKAASLAGLEVTGTGALGKRTYFQRKNTNHFVLDIKRTSDSPQVCVYSHFGLIYLISSFR